LLKCASETPAQKLIELPVPRRRRSATAVPVPAAALETA
jgi:hypothetical protein